VTTPRSARLAQRHGAGLEARLVELHATYDARGLAWVQRTPEAAVRGRGGVMQPFTRSVGADFHGVLAGGRAVAFDAKCLTDSGRLPIAPLVTRHAQWLDLQRHHVRGALAFYFVCVLGGEHVGDYCVPWSDVDAAISRGEKSVRLTDAYRVGGGDWLAALVPGGER
jgi:penicillin-binding protein-related factor A (putative recombinase)